MHSRKSLDLNPTHPQLGLDLSQRDARLRVHHGPQQILRRFEHRAAMAADALWHDRARLVQPPHELHGSRGTNLIASASLADRADLPKGAYNSPA
jgi:hypothetical protein